MILKMVVVHSINASFLDGLDYCSRAMETTSPEPISPVDGWKQHFPLPHHDGGYDAGKTHTSPFQLQRRWALIRVYSGH